MNPADAYELLRTITTQTDDFYQQIAHILTTIASTLEELR